MSELNKGSEDPEELFTVKEELGRGSYGSVYQAIHLPTGREVALKVLKLDASTDIKELRAEITLLSKINCPRIVQYYGSYIKNKSLWISMEYCDAGSALDILIQLKKHFTEAQINSVLLQAAEGLDYLHNMSPPIIHRDIKSGNILLNSKGEVKLADFGVATQLSDTLAKRQTQIGSPFWMAPEIIQESPYDTKVDIWSLGITAIELAQSKPPHWEHGSIRALFLIATKPPPKLDHPENWSGKFLDMVTRCLSRNPKDRPTARELTKHSFFVELKGSPEILQSLVDECFMEESEKSGAEDSFNRDFSMDSLSIGSSHGSLAREGASSVKFAVHGDPLEGETLTARGESIKVNIKKYKFIWFRSPGGEDDFVQIDGAVSQSPSYVTTREDVNCILKCTWLCEANGIESTISAFTDVIQPGAPQVKSIYIEGGAYYTRLFKLNVNYFGGEEGDSIIQWSKTSPDGSYQIIQGAAKSFYQPTIADIGHRLEVKYIPVRNDGAKGLPIYVTSKPILKVVGRVLLYTCSGFPGCMHAKALLAQKNVPFVEIDLFRFPSRKVEMYELTNGRKTVPQIFFNQEYIGGLKELLHLEENKKLNAMLKDVVEREPPDFPKVPTDEEADKQRRMTLLPKEDNYLYKQYLRMRSPKNGFQIKLRGPITRRVKTFKGTDFTRWMKISLKISTEEAAKLGQQMKSQSFFSRIKDNHLPFGNDSSLYRFEADIHDGLMLNCDQLYLIEVKKKKSPGSIARDLVIQMLSMVEKYAQHSGKSDNSINYASIGNSAEYRQYANTTLELQHADLSGLKEDELKAFFLNIHNCLAFHANIVTAMGLRGTPVANKGVVDYLAWGQLGYLINDQKFSLHDIKHGILRGNSKAPRRKIKNPVLSKHDPRMQFAVKFDPRIHFGLINGTRACSSLAIFSAKTIDADLQQAAESFLQEEVEVDKTRKHILLPKIFYFYNKDFGKNDNGIVHWILEYLGTKKEDFLAVQKWPIKFTKYDWDFCNTSNDALMEPLDQEYESQGSDSSRDQTDKDSSVKLKE